MKDWIRELEEMGIYSTSRSYYNYSPNSPDPNTCKVTQEKQRRKHERLKKRLLPVEQVYQEMFDFFYLTKYEVRYIKFKLQLNDKNLYEILKKERYSGNFCTMTGLNKERYHEIEKMWGFK
jgi:hypothetical protein